MNFDQKTPIKFVQRFDDDDYDGFCLATKTERFALIIKTQNNKADFTYNKQIRMI